MSKLIWKREDRWGSAAELKKSDPEYPGFALIVWADDRAASIDLTSEEALGLVAAVLQSGDNDA